MAELERFSAEGLAAAWEAEQSVRERIRNGENFITAVTDQNLDACNKLAVANCDISAPVLVRMTACALKLPDIDPLRGSVKALYLMASREVSDSLVDDEAWAIRHMAGFVKRKTQKKLVSLDPDFQDLCLILNPELEDYVQGIRDRAAEASAPLLSGATGEPPSEADDAHELGPGTNPNPDEPSVPNAVAVAAPTSNPSTPSAVVAPTSNPGQPLVASAAVVAAPTGHPSMPSVVAPTTNPGQPSMPSAVVVAAPIGNPSMPSVVAPTTNPGQPPNAVVVAAPTTNPGQTSMPNAVVAAPTTNPGHSMPSAVVVAPTTNPGQLSMPNAVVVAAPTTNPPEPVMPNAVVVAPTTNPGEPLMPSAIVAPATNPGEPMMPNAVVVASNPVPCTPILPGPRVVSSDSQPGWDELSPVAATPPPLSSPAASLPSPGDQKPPMFQSRGQVAPGSMLITPTRPAVTADEADTQPFDITTATPEFVKQSRTPLREPSTDDVELKRFKYQHPGEVPPPHPPSSPPAEVATAPAASQPVPPPTEVFGRRDQLGLRTSLKAKAPEIPDEVLGGLPADHVEQSETAAMENGDEAELVEQADAVPKPPCKPKRKKASKPKRARGLKKLRSMKRLKHDKGGDAPQPPHDGAPLDEEDDDHDDAGSAAVTARVRAKTQPSQAPKAKAKAKAKAKGKAKATPKRKPAASKNDKSCEAVAKPKAKGKAKASKDDPSEPLTKPKAKAKGKAKAKATPKADPKAKPGKGTRGRKALPDGEPDQEDVDYMISYFQSFENLEDRDTLKQQVQEHMPPFEYADSKRNVGYFSFGNCDAGLLVAIACAVCLGWFIEEHRISDPELAAISEKEFIALVLMILWTKGLFNLVEVFQWVEFFAGAARCTSMVTLRGALKATARKAIKKKVPSGLELYASAATPDDVLRMYETAQLGDVYDYLRGYQAVMGESDADLALQEQMLMKQIEANEEAPTVPAEELKENLKDHTEEAEQAISEPPAKKVKKEKTRRELLRDAARARILRMIAEMEDLLLEHNGDKEVFLSELLLIVKKLKKFVVKKDQGWYTEAEMKADLKWRNQYDGQWEYYVTVRATKPLEFKPDEFQDLDKAMARGSQANDAVGQSVLEDLQQNYTKDSQKYLACLYPGLCKDWRNMSRNLRLSMGRAVPQPPSCRNAKKFYAKNDAKPGGGNDRATAPKAKPKGSAKGAVKK
ncbi:hypothetical protein AK812_SmicGene7937 [Symbiodinium microadriaticum]|uniref:Uncharacterized protein n=1 Tax=Symbiodinium microadriaticum TaxID=2951 RepID=A0A1Q9EM59_SYMMI|nr:hypothetical protein AK812_SmicGene7937 [Symbiodinium microadriaticum]